jgi:hypothetical protein
VIPFHDDLLSTPRPRSPPAPFSSTPAGGDIFYLFYGQQGKDRATLTGLSRARSYGTEPAHRERKAGFRSRKAATRRLATVVATMNAVPLAAARTADGPKRGDRHTASTTSTGRKAARVRTTIIISCLPDR